MKRSLLSILCCLSILPTLSIAAQYTGHITKISMGSNANQNLVFEVANADDETCKSSWFKVAKPADQKLSPAEFVVKSYFNNSRITIHSPEICAPVSGPTQVNRVTLGTSTEEVKALIQQIRSKRKAVVNPNK